MFLRASKPDSDSIPLLGLLSRQPRITTIYLVADDVAVAQPYLDMLRPFAGACDLRVVSEDGLAGAILRSRIVCSKSQWDALEYSLLSRRAPHRVFIHHFHGLVTKSRSQRTPWRTGTPPRHLMSGLVDRVRSARYAYVTQGAVESYYRIAQWPHNPDLVQPVGYPRFYRAHELATGEAEAVISPAGQQLLASLGEQRKILYAPTRPADGGPPQLLRMAGFDAETFDAWLERHDAVLCIRLHATNEAGQWAGAKRLSRVVELPPDVAPGAVELLAHMDCVLTDWSSIMMEALALGLPLIHVLPDGEEIPVAFEPTVAMPGDHAHSQDELLKALERALGGNVAPSPAVDFWQLIPDRTIDEAYASLLRNGPGPAA